MRNAKRPNILLIYTDQQRWDSLGCYGNELAKTPNLDRLAAQGARLNHYFVQNPVCMPSRMSFLTSRYCGSLGIGTNGVPLPEDAMPVNQLLKPYGYQTAQIGKLHFRPHARRDHRDPTETYGFDTFILSDEPGCYDDAYIKWVERIAPDQVEHVRSSLPPAAAQYGRPTYSDQPRNTHEPYAFAGDAVDIVPTILDFCAVQTPSFVQGQSIRHLLTGTGTTHRPDALTEAFDADGRHRSASLRTDRYRYDCAADGSEWLYDLADDPDELNNVAEKLPYQPIMAEVRKRLLVRLQSAAYVRAEKEVEY